MLGDSDSQGRPPSTFPPHTQDSRDTWKSYLAGGALTVGAWRKRRDTSAPEDSLMAM